MEQVVRPMSDQDEELVARRVWRLAALLLETMLEEDADQAVAVLALLGALECLLDDKHAPPWMRAVCAQRIAGGVEVKH